MYLPPAPSAPASGVVEMENKSPTPVLCCQIDCHEEAEFQIIEDRDDIHPAELFTESCEKHVGELLGTVRELNCPWRWIVTRLKRKCG